MSTPLAAFDKIELTIDCPKCAEKIRERLGLLKNKTALDCPACGNNFRFDPESLKDAREYFQRSVAKIPRTITIKLGKK